MLARLALDQEFTDWSDPEALENLRIIDPACGTGTLLMAALHVIKARAREAQRLDDDGVAALHRQLVENSLCGLDINRHAVQLAACNLTLGAPTVDYRRMNLLTLRNGPQPNGDVRSGSLEILVAADASNSLRALRRPLLSLDGVEAEQVDRSGDVKFPLSGLDMVLMNPPFTSNDKRHRQFDRATVKRMQQHEMGIRDEVEARDDAAGGVIDANSLRTFFTPLMDRLLNQESGVLASVLPVTACTNASGRPERRFQANRFQVALIVTSHDPKALSFSENTSINECLQIARRPARSRTGSRQSGDDACFGRPSEFRQGTGRPVSGTTAGSPRSDGNFRACATSNRSGFVTGSAPLGGAAAMPLARVIPILLAQFVSSGRSTPTCVDRCSAPRRSGELRNRARSGWRAATGARRANFSLPRSTERRRAV